MKILIVSGFLGAGKTKFIQTMSEKTHRKFVIVENEFGDLNIDGERLRQQAESLDLNDKSQASGKEAFNKIVELTEGCICCSLNLDFNHSILTIANTLDPDYLVVEPSGVAKTGNIVEHIQTICYEKIEVLAPITIVDGKVYQETRKIYPDTFSNQVSVAGTVVVSKSEDFTKDDFERIKKDLKVPDDTSFPEEHYGNWSEEDWWNLLNYEYVKKKPENVNPLKGRKRFVLRKVEKKHEVTESLSFIDFEIPNTDFLVVALNILMSGCVGHVVRAKGYYPMPNLNESLNFDFVEGQYAITGMPLTKDKKMVVLGKNINKDAISALFKGTPYHKQHNSDVEETFKEEWEVAGNNNHI